MRIISRTQIREELLKADPPGEPQVTKTLVLAQDKNGNFKYIK